MNFSSSILLLIPGQLLPKLVCALIVTPLVIGASSPVFAQDAAQTSDIATATPVSIIPQQIRYSGKLPTRSGDNAELVFRIYAAPEGGDPLWTETQQVNIAEDGSYSILLGSATAAGLPQSVFAAGAARWLGISIDRDEEPTRALLSSVPYAMESADAQSLAGHHAADFVTQKQLVQTQDQLAHVQALIQTFAQAAPHAPPSRAAGAQQPNLDGPVLGSGTAGTIPLWTDSATIENSEIVQGTAGIGINQPNPAATLDVGGSVNVAGILNLPPLATATIESSHRSQLIQLSDSAYSTSYNAPITSTFKILANYVDSNTANPGGQLEIHYQASPYAASRNVLSIAGNGVINFAPNQTFPGTVASVSAASPLTATTTAGAASVGLNETTLVSDISSAIASSPNLTNNYAQLGAANTFSQGQTIQGSLSLSGDEAVQSDTGGPAIEAFNSTAGIAIEGLASQIAESIGVLGTLSAPSGQSSSFNSLYFADGFNPGVWADAPNNLNVLNSAALIATADNSYAGVFYNDSSTISTIIVLNNSPGGPTGNAAPIANVMRIGGPGGTCGFNQSGNLSCTGQVKSIVPSKDGARQLETYSVQSAENWIEDYGSARLTNGSATVTVESAFADTVNTGIEYHVFLTPGGDCKGLYVTNKTPTSFEVHELGGGLSTIPFDYKIVAKRNGLESQRLVDVTDRMKLETEQSRLKPLANPLPRPIKLQRQ